MDCQRFTVRQETPRILLKITKRHHSPAQCRPNQGARKVSVEVDVLMVTFALSFILNPNNAACMVLDQANFVTPSSQDTYAACVLTNSSNLS